MWSWSAHSRTLYSDNDLSLNQSAALSLNHSAAISLLATHHPTSHVASHLTPADIQQHSSFFRPPSVRRLCGLSVVGAGLIFAVTGAAAL
jgi:hypothetical protein